MFLPLFLSLPYFLISVLLAVVALVLAARRANAAVAARALSMLSFGVVIAVAIGGLYGLASGDISI